MNYESVYEPQNLYNAYRKARKGKRDQPSVASFEYNLEENLFGLRTELSAFLYQPGQYYSFYRTESKRRLISAAPFRDRVVHHALINVIGNEFEKCFIDQSYANRTGKGTHRALDTCTRYLRSSKYSLQCDVAQFFPAIDHQILSELLGRKIHDNRLLWLCNQIISTGAGILDSIYQPQWFPGDSLFEALRPKGLPIGNLTSQFWANVYLNPLDHFVKRVLKVKKYVRYVDDLILFGEDKFLLNHWLIEIKKFLQDYRLQLHGTSPIRPSSEGLPFLGFLVFPDHRRIRSPRVWKFSRGLREKIQAYRAGNMPIDQLHRSVQGWVEHVRHGDSWGLRRAVLSKVSI